MPREGRRALGVVLALLLVAGAGAGVAVGAATFLLPVPGLRAGAVQLAGVERTADGGGLLAASLRARRRTPAGRLIVARLEADGALDLAYGWEGLTAPGGRSRLQPTALAVDPVNGTAWIGGQLPDGSGAILALDGTGNRRTGFGRHGLLRLPAADAGGPVALAWSHGALLAAAGPDPCRGCSLSLRDPVSGRLEATTQLGGGSPPAGGDACAITGVTGAIFTAPGRALVSTRVGQPASCRDSLRAFDGTLGSLAAPSPDWLSGAEASVVDGGPGAACVAASHGSSWLVGPLAAAAGGHAVTAGGSGSLVALVALGPGACAALVRPDRGRAQVTQVAASPPVRSLLPGQLAALGMFRCHAHLLVLGTVRQGGRQQVVIDPQPVRLGRYAARARLAATDRIAPVAPAVRTTGCR